MIPVEHEGRCDSAMDKDLKDYRDHLVTARQKAQEDFDKTVLSLSGGALGISFAFIKDIVGAGPFQNPAFLLLSWILWASSITAVMVSYFFSHLALCRAISQVDGNRIYKERPGGCHDIITAILNTCGGLLFLAGVAAIIYFVSHNLPEGRPIK
jgi:hypothetical protein